MSCARFLIVTIVCWRLIVASTVLAGGSISWDEVRAQIQKEDPEFLALIEQAFDIRHVGGALRVGHDASGKSTVEGVEVGTRMLPYEFLAKLKGTESNYTLHLTFVPSEIQGHPWQVTVRRKLDAD
jgi:hypothetical protein